MALVPAICTQCGAQIEVDDSHEAGICKHCGTAFITEKVIKLYTTNITNNNNFAGANINIVGGDIDNLLELAQNAIDISNEKDALKYSERALEINVRNSRAWFIKMQAEKIRIQKEDLSIENGKAIEGIAAAGNNAIKYSSDDYKVSMTKQVHKFYLESVSSFLYKMKVELSNTGKIELFAKKYPQLALSNDQKFLLLYVTTTQLFTLKLVDELSAEEISLDKELQNLLVECINMYVDMRLQYQSRIELYCARSNAEAVRNLKEAYDNLVEKLPLERRSEVKEWTITENGSQSNYGSSISGCYIATCVYGSYDCPEVWTLRRFRDFTLDETWYGRLFIKCYYAISPAIVKKFGETKWFRSFWKTTLDKMVRRLNEKGVENTKYNDKY